MRMKQETALVSVALVLGLLVMTIPSPPLDASEAQARRELLVTDLTSGSTDLGWYVQNDNVMGGRSQGGFKTGPGGLIFAGSTNTNGGGFSSIRTQPFQLDLSSYDGIRLAVKGDGRRYTWELQTTARWRGRRISYWADFATRQGEQSTVEIPFSSFVPQFRGYKLDGPELDPREIREMALYIYDQRDGPFELRLDSVRAYSAAAH
ncbi:MAG: CIA30 family protein [Gammaproteobacteria bacterium]|nr:CIA30 family protein [Gammaproteobacteria bacterium]